MVYSGRCLGTAEAAAAIAAQFQHLAGLRTDLLGEGTDHCAYELGERYVFRFPKAEEGAAALVTEAHLTAWLSGRLPLAIPEYVYLSASGRGHMFGGYRKLEGASALVSPPERLDAVQTGHTLGAFLKTLHGCDPGVASRLGVVPDDDPEFVAWSEEAVSDLGVALQAGHLSDVQATDWLRVVSRPPPPSGSPRVPGVTRPTLLHGDFAAEHVLLTEQGRPSGIIDWSDARLGDPAHDLAGLLHWGNPRLWSAVLDTYGSVDAALYGRACWLAVCRALGDLAYGVSARRPAYLRSGQRALAELRAEFDRT